MVEKQASGTAALPADLATAMQEAGMWRESCPVPLNRLALVTIKYVDFQGDEHDDGELVTMDVAAEFVAQLFDKLFALRFPIARIRSPHHYQGSDDLSMADNNTSCFHDRPLEHTTVASLHSYGLAIDINPLQNPFIQFDELKGTAVIQPAAGWQYLNRHNREPGMLEDVVPALAAEQGFSIWGGSWTTPIDYHHFQTPRGVAELLVEMPREEGRAFFLLCIKLREQLPVALTPDKTKSLIQTYRERPADFLKTFAAEIENR